MGRGGGGGGGGGWKGGGGGGKGRGMRCEDTIRRVFYLICSGDQSVLLSMSICKYPPEGVEVIAALP